MDLAGYVINAVLVEGRSVAEAAADHGISRSWLSELLARYRTEVAEGLSRRVRRKHLELAEQGKPAASWAGACATTPSASSSGSRPRGCLAAKA